MSTKALVFIETENAFIQDFYKILKGQFIQDKYSLVQISPEYINGPEKMADKCIEDIKKKFEEFNVLAIYVDLSIKSNVVDKWGIDLGMVIRKAFPDTPIFSMTNKNKYDNNFDNLSDATLEDFDGVFEKNYLLGTDFSEERLETMLKKAREKRTLRYPYITNNNGHGNEPNLPFKCDVAIVAALYEYEFEQIQLLVDVNTDLSREGDTSSVVIGKLKNSKLNVVIDYQKKMGQVDAAILATGILSKYRPTLLVMTGVCGGRSTKDVNIGDIIIPSEIYDYQMGKYDNDSFKPYAYRAAIDDDLLSKVRSWKKEILRIMEDEAALNSQRVKTSKVLLDVMACGSLVIKKDGLLDYISETLDDKTVAVEMESYGFARTCNIHPYKNITKAIVIKASMDSANKNKTDNDKEWAAHISTRFAYHFIKKLELDGFFN